MLDHGQGITTSYAHLQYALVKVDQLINGGQPIRISGHTGKSTAPHLHLTFKINGININSGFFNDKVEEFHPPYTKPH